MLKYFLLFLFISCPAMAQDTIKLNQWAQLPVLHDGRLKPLDSFAHLHLKRFSNKETINRINANQWLAQIIFTPEDDASTRIFHVRNFENLKLEKRKNKLYSYVEITATLEQQKNIIEQLHKTNPQEWTPEQQNLITLHDNANILSLIHI